MNMSSPDFDRIKQTNPYGIDYWSARDLMPLLGYGKKWQNFEKVIQKAIIVCEKSQQNPCEHFAATYKSVPLGSGSKRGIIDYRLSYYALHLILLFSDLRKPRILQAVAYFSLTKLDFLNGDNDHYTNTEASRISIPSDISITKEQITIGQIKKAFKNVRALQQYRVAQYRVDLYFPDYRIAVECDEGGHRSYTREEEVKRQKYIEENLDCIFVRYNPDDPAFNIGDVIHQIIALVYKDRKGQSNDRFVI